MTLVFNLLIGLGVAFLGFVVQTANGGIIRKVIGRLQRRRGPIWYQEFLDIFKACSRRAITHGWIFDFGVIMAVGGIAATAMFMPIAHIVAFPGYDNFFIFVYLLAVGMLGMAMSASGSGNPNASIGVMRALTSMMAYEVPFLVIVLTIIKITGTSSLSELAAYQQSNQWFALYLPIGFIVSFISLMAMLGKKPFETFIAPAEIASGPMVEYGGKQLGLLFIMHELTIFIEVSLFVNLFLGGGPTVFLFFVKYFMVYLVASLISNVLGRWKVDDVVIFFYKWPLFFAVIQALLVIFGVGIYG